MVPSIFTLVKKAADAARVRSPDARAAEEAALLAHMVDRNVTASRAAKALGWTEKRARARLTEAAEMGRVVSWTVKQTKWFALSTNEIKRQRDITRGK
ncbi:MAG: hypothetical protein RBU21_25345 [FCB group bacterium]|jgi:hypothetical protein|nr:hypothetical protein [FCB group bacterium]